MCAFAQAPTKDTRTLAQKLDGFDLNGLKKLGPNQLADVRPELQIDDHVLAFVYYALPPASIQSAFKDFLKTIESARNDQQMGEPFRSTATARCETDGTSL